jgi:UDP-N-acetylmuramate dehydrogenase
VLPEGGELLHRLSRRGRMLSRLSALPGQIDHDVPLSTRTTLHIGGNAAALFTPTTPDALGEAVALCHAEGIPHLLLGAGSNLLFPDEGYPGLVIATQGLARIEPGEGSVTAQCGARLPRLLSALGQDGIHSLDFLAGIPGSLGGAVAMNAGIPARTISDAVESVTVLSADGRPRTIPSEKCAFAYRSSLFRSTRLAVLSATLRLDGPDFDGRMLLAYRRTPHPLDAWTAGCAFKNPPGESAGRLIEGAGLKGFRVGMAKVSELHANFIVNLGGARCAEIRKLIDIVHQKVYKSFQISLELEIEVIEG